MIWDMPNLEIIETELQKFPMVEAGVLKCEVIPIKPYTGFAELFKEIL